MIKKKLYRYLGRNGIITSLVELINVNHVDMYRLEASSGMLLTDGEKTVYTIDIYVEDLDKWYEIPNPKISDNNNE